MHTFKTTMLTAILVVSTLSQEEQIHEITPEELNIEEINEGVHQIVEHSTEEHKDDQIVEHHVNAHPKYEFKYGVKDTHTQDIKEQAEIRDGHKVAGYYKLVESDGTTRTVHYSSDKHIGFQAKVDRAGLAAHPVSQPHNYQAAIVNPVNEAQDISHHTASSYSNIQRH